MSQVVGSRDLDLSLLKGELVAVVSEADSRGDRRRWLVDAGGENQNQQPSMGELGADGRELIAEPRGGFNYDWFVSCKSMKLREAAEKQSLWRHLVADCGICS